MKKLSADRLYEVFDYDPETGVFIQKLATGRKSKIGAQVGRPGPSGRTVIAIDGVTYYATHLAWLWVNGEWPAKSARLVYKGPPGPAVRFADIEAVTQAELSAGGKINTLNKSGIKGVSWVRASGKWTATITRNGRQHYLGKFATKEEAAAAYRHAVETGELRGTGSIRDPNWQTSRRQRSAKWKDIQFDPAIVGWPSIEAFLADVGPPPSPKHVLMRKSLVADALPLGPGNAEWRVPLSKRADGMEGRELRQAYSDHSKFELEPGEREAKLREQDGRCAICNRTEAGLDRGFAVDHSHTSGMNRSLLCGSCNMGLGSFGDDPVLLRRAADYIEAWRDRHASAARFRKGAA